MKLSVVNTKNGRTELACAEGAERVHLVYGPAYRKGDAVVLTTDGPGFYRVRLEDTVEPAVLYADGKEIVFPIPFGVDRAGYSPRAFGGKRHFLEAEKTDAPSGIRNLAFNPIDGSGNEGLYPHMTTNVTYPDTFRNKIFPDRGLFAPRNVIDGILANESHRLYPHQSWGINRMADAWLRCDFGRPVDVTEIALAIRGEFPHDNYWVKGKAVFSDGSTEELTLTKTLDWQRFPAEKKGITSITLTDLVPSDEPSPFPALSGLMVYGREGREENNGGTV